MIVSFTLEDAARILLYALAVGIGVLLVIALVRLIEILKKLNRIIADNRDDFGELMTVLPIVLRTVNESVRSAKNTMDSAKETFGLVSGTLAKKTVRAIAGADNIFDLVKIFGQLLVSTIGYFRKDLVPKRT